MIRRTWDKQMATYSSQPDGPLKGAGGYIYIYIYFFLSWPDPHAMLVAQGPPVMA